MGIGQSIAQNMEKMQENQIQMQRVMLERQICMQNAMRERMAATQFGMMKERFYWFTGFFSTVLVGTAHQMQRTGNRAFLLPNIPFLFFLTYQAHMIYGDKAKTIRELAEHELIENPDLFAMPLGPITFEDIELRRIKKEHDAKFRPNDAFL